jgi:hypothetical protein
MNFNASSTPGSYTGSVQVQGTGLLSGSATCTIPIILTLWKPISISKTADLAFGGIQPAAAAAVVRVAPQTGTRTLTSGAATLVSGQPAVAGQFTVTGRASTSISITLPTSTTITNAGGATMTVNNFTRYPAGTTTLDASGNLSLYVGADLNVAANQATGKYSGTYTITVNY